MSPVSYEIVSLIPEASQVSQINLRTPGYNYRKKQA